MTRHQRHIGNLIHMAMHGYDLVEVVYNGKTRISSDRIKKTSIGYKFLYMLPDIWTDTPFYRSWKGHESSNRLCFRFVSKDGNRLTITTWKKLGEFVNLHKRDHKLAERLFDEWWTDEERSE